MNLMELAEEINQILEEMYFDPQCKPYRLPVCVANNDIIRELKNAVEFAPWLSWTVMGVVGGKKHFIMHNHMSKNGMMDYHVPDKDQKAGELIVVDFKAKKVLSRQAA
jgi:hypothetical protein